MTEKPSDGYIVELETGTWLAEWHGDPGRTRDKDLARRFGSRHGARVALGFARRYRFFPFAEIRPITRKEKES